MARELIKFNFKGETLLSIVTLLLMWVGYYIDNHGFFESNMIWTIGIWGIGGIVILDVVFPAWWIVIKKREGFAGMGITTKKIGLTLLLGTLLGVWRFFELLPYLKDDGFFRVILFNLLSIWEVCFIFCWLFTRYIKAFGKAGAVILTALSVGLYHVGSLPVNNILYLMFCVFICGICFSITDNIFTLWPIYWIVGCSASVLRGYGSDMFGWDMVMVMGIGLLLQLFGLGIIKLRAGKARV
jgi:hypothetical protein